MKCVLCVLKNAHCKEPSKADVRFLKATIFVYLSYNYARASTCATIRMHLTFVRIRTDAYTATGNIACLRSLTARQKEGISYSCLINFQRKVVTE